MPSRRRSAVVLVAALLVLSFAASGYGGQRFGVYKRPKGGGPRAVPGEVLVKFKAAAGAARRAEARRRHGVATLYTSRRAGFERVRIPEGRTVAQVVAALRQDKDVEYAQPNSICRATMTPTDPLYSSQWHMDIPQASEGPEHGANGGGINVEPAWDISQGQGVVVAVLDSGVAYENYRDPKTRVRYKKAPDLANTSFVPGHDFINHDSHANDDNSHGTHVAGTIAQSTNNGVGVAGVAFQCSIMPVKVLDRDGYGTAAALIDGLDFAADNGAKVINMSLSWGLNEDGTPYYPGELVHAAILRAHSKGVVLVASSGNDGQAAVAYPAAYPECIAVGATRYDEARSGYSNYGPALDIVAPGGDVGVDQNGDGYGDGVLQNTFNPTTRRVSDFGYWYFDGTSMAAPHVAGVAALVIASGVTDRDAVVQRLLTTAEDKGPAGWDAEYGHGIVDAAAALQSGPKITIDSVTAAPASVPKYDKVELEVALSQVAATAFYDPDPAQGGLALSATFTSPSSATWQVNGFYDGSAWRIRFAPDEAGAWSFTVTATDSSGADTWTGGSFTCTTSAHPGWARVDGHVLRFSEGQSIFAVGHNTGWQDSVEQPTLTEMAAKGENLLSFWLAQPWAERSWLAARTPIENVEQGVGNYNQDACTYLDGVVAGAEAAGVYLLPTLWSHGQVRDDSGNPPFWGDGWWYNNAYSAICTATDFFSTTDGGSDTEQWRRQKNFYRYLLARWGYSRAVVGWVTMCEIQGTTGYYNSSAQATAWCAAVQDYFRANDACRRNGSGQHPSVVTQSDAPTWDGASDLRATDSYASQADDVAVANTIATQTTTMRTSSGEPSFHAEFGGDTSQGATQPAHLHNGIWAGSATGAAMTPLVWCDGGNWPMLTTAMQNHLQYLSEFIAGIAYLDDPALAAATVTIAAPCRGWGMKLSDRGYAWVQNTAGTMGGQTLTLTGLGLGNYTVAWYDAWTSGATPIQSDTVTVGADGVLTAAIPTLAQADIACTFERIPNQAPLAANDSYATDEDITLAVPVAAGVLLNDTDPDGQPLTATLVAGPAHGTLDLAPDGSFTYTPDADYSGDDSFTYKASDGIDDSNVATVTITIGPVNDPPVASDDSAETLEGTPVTIDVLANDSDPDGDAIGVTDVTQPANGSAAINPDDTITYTPDPGFTGSDPFTYTISDGNGGIDSAAVAVHVNPATPTATVAIDLATVTVRSKWYVVATVVVTDAAGAPIAGATVAAHWSGYFAGTASATTGADGVAAFQTPQLKKTGTVTFTVDGVAKDGQDYTLAGETSDSIAGAATRTR